jgi:tetratricopeptide (TPR) repeat protein
MEHIFRDLHVPTIWFSRAKLVFALIVFGLVLAFWFALPWIAREYYNNRGATAAKDGEYSKAVERFQRAVTLNPDYAEAQFNLGDAYERSLDYDKAIAAYQAAIRTDHTLDRAYNNLARLVILAKKDYTGALDLLERALQLRPQDKNVLFSIHKNRAWANFALKNYREAEADLIRAAQYDTESAYPHCIRAQIMDATGKADQARLESMACLRAPQGSVESFWIEFASDHADNAGGKK